MPFDDYDYEESWNTAAKLVRRLEHELALARASSDYWRAKYIDEWKAIVHITFPPSWVGLKEQTPIDECYG